MRKSTVFISVLLSTFVLVMLYNVASAYRQSARALEIADPPAATLEPTVTEAPASTEVSLSPEEAAHLAAQVVGNSNLLSAESSSINGVDAYKITFANNDVVYIGPDGQILSVQVAPVVVNAALPVKQKSKNNNKNQNASSPPAHEENHEEAHEHED